MLKHILQRGKRQNSSPFGGGGYWFARGLACGDFELRFATADIILAEETTRRRIEQL
jgi:hypothetical protein